MTFAEKLNDEIAKRGWNAHQLAIKSGVPYTTLKSLLMRQNAKTKVLSYRNAVAVCKALGVPVDYFGDCDDVRMKDADDQTNPPESR